MKVAGEIYGRGPLLTALPDIKTLNKTLELLLKNASLAVAGCIQPQMMGCLTPDSQASAGCDHCGGQERWPTGRKP
jgi:hypothetical protein